MAVYPGTYIPVNAHTSDRVNSIVDNMLTPRMMMFRQIVIYDEAGTLMNDNETWRFTYGNWNTTYNYVVRKNGQVLASTDIVSSDPVFGTVNLGAVVSGDNVSATYCFDYFPIGVLAGYLGMSVETVNSSAYGPPTSYSLSDAPQHWDSVLSDLAFALAMERLILDYDLWVGRLIFALPSIEDGGDIIGTLETLKQNAENRAAKTLDNEKFKSGNLLSVPTQNYYNAVYGFGRSGAHGSASYGRTRGYRINKLF
jgi:hypothetical protein